MIVTAFETVELTIGRAERGLRDESGQIGGRGVAQ
jgi:hypothetical protein